MPAAMRIDLDINLDQSILIGQSPLRNNYPIVSLPILFTQFIYCVKIPPKKIDSTMTAKPLKHYFILFTLILAGEMLFSLPFHISRFFRPTFLEVFELTNTQFGDVIAVYGIIAMLAYFPGGQ